MSFQISVLTYDFSPKYPESTLSTEFGMALYWAWGSPTVYVGKAEKGEYQPCSAAWDRMHSGEEAKVVLCLVMDGTQRGIPRVLGPSVFCLCRATLETA